MKTESELMETKSALESEVRAIKQKVYAIEADIAALRATRKGLKLGSIVFFDQKIGYGSKIRTVRKRFKVNRIAYREYGTGLTLWGITLKKDGTEGEKREICQDFQVE